MMRGLLGGIGLPLMINGACAPAFAYDIPVSGCIQSGSVIGTQPRDDRRIDYRLKDGTRLRNDLPVDCRGLNYEQDFDYATMRAAICPGDRIVVANRAAGPGEPTGAVCPLGDFSPVSDN